MSTTLQPNRKLTIPPDTTPTVVISNDAQAAGSFTIIIGENTPPDSQTLASEDSVTFQIPPQTQAAISNTGQVPLEIDY